MLTRIQHVALGVGDLATGSEAYRRLGFELRREGACAIAFNDADFLELRDDEGLSGLRHVAIESDQVDADSAAIASRGAAAFVVLAGPRRQPAGAAAHPNGVYKLERVYIAVKDIAVSAAEYARALGVPVPKVERGTVINADMAVFNFGPPAQRHGLTLAQPVAPGVAEEAQSRGLGPFQVLYRTRSMDAAARWMAEQGVPPPARGIRNTGEQAMLVPPQHACGVYIGFVGPA